MAHRNIFDDSDWDEVVSINGYAVFMGYLMMGIRGLGLLVITWTTVVLLGGFVSVLGAKDFWCLTGITLVQTAGVFNFLFGEAMNDFMRSWVSILTAIVGATFMKGCRKGKSEDVLIVWAVMIFLIYALWLIHALMLVIILCPVVILYVLGVYISAGVALWRLIEHDFGNVDEDGNLKPALEVLYSLAVAQGILYGYKYLNNLGAKALLAKFVTHELDDGSVDNWFKKNGSVDKDIILAYQEDTIAGCEKDPSFASGRNFVTYGMDLMVEAKSNDGFIAGIRLLGTVLNNARDDTFQDCGRKVLAKHLLTSSASYTRTIQRLLQTLGPRSPYNREIREHAARIVAHVADGIHLEHFPGGIECMSSLFDTSEAEVHGASWRGDPYLREYERHFFQKYERHWLLEKYEQLYLTDGRYGGTHSAARESSVTEGLVIEGQNIIRKLAVYSGNRRIIINAEGLVPKINMVPLLLDKLHKDDHSLWEKKVQQHWELMSWLMASPAEAAARLPGEISSSHREATFSNLISIVECSNCASSLKIQVTGLLLLDPSVDTSFIMANDNRRRMFTWILLLVFLSPDEDRFSSPDPMMQRNNSDIGRLAGEKLSAMLTLQCDDEASARGFLQLVRFVLEDLTGALVDASNISNRLHAAKILIHLCYRYNENGEYLMELKTAMVRVMPEVLNELLSYMWTSEETLAVKKANSDVQPSLEEIDLEVWVVAEGRVQEHTASCQQQSDEQREELRQALRFLCGIMWGRWHIDDSDVWGRWHMDDSDVWDQGHIDDSDVSRQLDEIAARICSEQGKSISEFVPTELFIYS